MTASARRDALLWGGDLWTDLLLLGALCAAVSSGFATELWVAGSGLSWVIGHDAGPGLVHSVRLLLSGEEPHHLWPAVPVPLLIVATALLVVMTAAGAAAGVLRWRAAHPPVVGFAGAGQLTDLLPGRAGVARARRLRPSLPARGDLAPRELGVPLGRLRRQGPVLRASWEDVVLAICAPRLGKTTSLAVPAILDAPGPVVATSNKADVWELRTSPQRPASTGWPGHRSTRAGTRSARRGCNSEAPPIPAAA